MRTPQQLGARPVVFISEKTILGMDLLKQVDLAIDYEGSQIGFRIPPIKE